VSESRLVTSSSVPEPGDYGYVINANPANFSRISYRNQSLELSPSVWAELRSKVEQGVDKLIVSVLNLLILVLKALYLPERNIFLVHTQNPKNLEVSLSFPVSFAIPINALLIFSPALLAWLTPRTLCLSLPTLVAGM
jgi:hypothetical protein